MRLTKSGDFVPLMASALSRSTTSFGVPAGTVSPNHTPVS